MRRVKKMSFNELVNENKKLLMNDKEAIEKIEERVEERRVSKLWL